MSSVEIAVSKVRRIGPWHQRFAQVAIKAPVAIPVAILLLFVLAGILAPWLAPYPENEVKLSSTLRPPVWQEGGSPAYILGTDTLGRDILSRIIYGARVSLLVVVVAIPVAGAIGVSLGMLAGYRGGWAEATIMRLVDIKLSLPTVLLALMFAVVWGPSLVNLLVLVVLTIWAVYARVVHGETLSLKERDYVLAARSIGASDFRILLLHVLPHLANTIVILATLQIGSVVLLEAALSFIGVGIPPPRAAWGQMIAAGRSELSTAWWVSTMPGVALSLLIVSANLVGDWLRDYLDPTLRRIKK